MRHRLLALSIPLCAVLFGTATCAQPVADTDRFSDADAAAVRANLDAFVTSDPLASPDTFFSQFTDDVFWEPGPGVIVTGMEELRNMEWCGTLLHERTVERVEGSGDLAYVRGTFQLALDCGEANPVERQGSFISIHRRQPDGSWRIATMVSKF